MARIGANARLNISGGRWQVIRGNKFGVNHSLVSGGGLGYWWVRETGARREGIAKHRHRVQRDAVMDAEMMNLRYP